MSDRLQTLLFHDLASRKVQADFSGGHLSSDGGVLLLRQIDRGLGLTRALAVCFNDARNPLLIDHTVEHLLSQRLYGVALGYEDLNDHERLRLDPLLAVACEKRDPFGQDRLLPKHRGIALAAPSTLNRLELSNNKKTPSHKIPHDPAKIEACLLKMGARCLPRHAREVVLDLDAMGHLLHGQQEGRHFNAYYDNYCYLPLYVFAGDFPLWAQLRTADHSPAHGVVPALEKIVAAIRQRCPKARIILRADSGFCTEEIMAWCESQKEVYFCLGLAKNPVLIENLAPALAAARMRHCLCGAATRGFNQFEYQTKKSWSRSRRVIGKAEITRQGDNPRFLVTNLPEDGFAGEAERTRFEPQSLYEDFYCPRGEMENVLKQQVLDLNADRMSTEHLASNQLRLWFSTFAYLLLERMRSLTLHGTELANATAGTLRVKLLKVAAEVKVSVRRIYVRFCSAFPMPEIFSRCVERLRTISWQTG